MSISVIVPSVGRKTLVNTLLSLIPQLTEEDEIVVVMDGYHAPEITALSPQITYVELPKKVGDYGNTARDKGIEASRGSHLAFCDDDDIFTKAALATMRRAVKFDPNTPWVFKMEYGDHPTGRGVKLWIDRAITPGNVGTPMVLIPKRDDLPKWAAGKDHPFSDFMWIDKVCNQMYNSDVRFDSDVVCLVRPDKQMLEEQGLA